MQDNQMKILKPLLFNTEQLLFIAQAVARENVQSKGAYTVVTLQILRSIKEALVIAKSHDMCRER